MVIVDHPRYQVWAECESCNKWRRVPPEIAIDQAPPANPRILLSAIHSNPSVVAGAVAVAAKTSHIRTGLLRAGKVFFLHPSSGWRLQFEGPPPQLQDWRPQLAPASWSLRPCLPPAPQCSTHVPTLPVCPSSPRMPSPLSRLLAGSGHARDGAIRISRGAGLMCACVSLPVIYDPARSMPMLTLSG